ncbi:site-specific DNA-methyltransferase, partial [Escherichia coli]|nr:site-specific DNA-methyltransferase [Escherichia coli]
MQYVKHACGCECRLRRYFGVTAQVPYTDVWTHK